MVYPPDLCPYGLQDTKEYAWLSKRFYATLREGKQTISTMASVRYRIEGRETNSFLMSIKGAKIVNFC